jgi:predicted PurR-regulated permease PerM
VRLLFAAVGFVAAVPFLLRLRRRFASWIAPAIALGLMAAAFSVSSFVVGPALGGEDDPAPRQSGVSEQQRQQQPATHDEHH